MRPGPFSEGELVVLVDPYNQRYLLRLQAGQKYSCQHGAVAHDALIGQVEGSILRSTKDVPLVAFRPTLSDYVLKMKRGAQILYPKDLGSIFMRADVFPGARVFEAGAGSGALTLLLLRAVGPTGRVVSYEVRPEFAERARLNVVGLLGQCPTWTLKVRDVYQGIEEEPFDRVILDLPAAWDVLPQAEAALRPGGILVAFFPTIRQIEETAAALERLPTLRLVEIFESIERPWQARGLSVRPHQRIIGHTGFIIVARKLAAPGIPGRQASSASMPATVSERALDPSSSGQDAPWERAVAGLVGGLRKAFRDELVEVRLYGSRARGTATPDSDIDVLVILDPLPDFWAAFHRIGAMASEVSLAHDVVVSALPASLDEYRNGATPPLINARRESVRIA